MSLRVHDYLSGLKERVSFHGSVPATEPQPLPPPAPATKVHMPKVRVGQSFRIAFMGSYAGLDATVTKIFFDHQDRPNVEFRDTEHDIWVFTLLLADVIAMLDAGMLVDISGMQYNY